MTPANIGKLIDEILADLPERVSGNEGNRVVIEQLRQFAKSDRIALVECLGSLLSFRSHGHQRTNADVVREARVWFALDAADALELSELRPKIEMLVRDIRRGLIFKPVHEGMAKRYLDRIPK